MSWQPRQEIELVAGTPAGGGQDRPARALLQVLAAEGLIDVPARLTNIPGRGGGNAWDHLARHTGNPHVVAINSPTLITNRQLGVSDFDDRALTPLATLYTEYIAFLVRADSAISDGAALLARLRRPADITIAMATARGNTNHMALGRLARHAGADPRAKPKSPRSPRSAPHRNSPPAACARSPFPHRAASTGSMPPRRCGPNWASTA